MLFSVIFFSYRTKARIQFKRGHGCSPKQWSHTTSAITTFLGSKPRHPSDQKRCSQSTTFYVVASSLTVPSTLDAKPFSVSAPVKDRLKVSSWLGKIFSSKAMLASDGAEKSACVLRRKYLTQT